MDLTRVILLWWLSALIVCAQSVTVPATNLPATGSYLGVAGVRGGIDQYSTNYTLFCNVEVAIPGYTNVAYGDGLHDDTAALQAAITGATNQSYVYLPAGQYLISAPLQRFGINTFDGTEHPFSFIIRGAGPTNTFILNNGYGSAIWLAAWSGWSPQGPVGGTFRGATNLTLGASSFYPIQNQWILVDRSNWVANVYAPSNTSSYQFFYVYGGTSDYGSGGGSAAQLVKIQSVTGTTNVVVWPPLNEGYGPTNDIYRETVSWPSHCGIENLCVAQLQENNAHDLRIVSGDECWVRNVETRQARGYHISLEWCGGCEVRECYVHDPFINDDGADAGGGSDYGIVLGFHSSCCLVEDNLALHCRHSFIMETAAGQDNVVSYNYGHDNIDEGMFETDFQEDTDYHGGEQRYCLWEGNVVPIIRADTTEGATKFVTYFRNEVTRDGLNTVTNNTGASVNAVVIERGHWYDYIYDNVYLKCYAAGGPSVYELGYAGDVPTSEIDYYVWTNNTWRGNFNANTNTYDGSTNGVIYFTSSYNLTFTNSMLYTNKPSWFGTNVWPPIGADLADMTNLIPAQTRALALPAFTNPVADGYVLTVGVTPAHAGTTVTPGTGSYYNGAWVMATATAVTTNVFSYWSGTTFNSPYSTAAYLVMPARPLTVTANFGAGAGPRRPT